MVQKPVRRSLSKQVLEEMEKCITSGQWAVGERIPAEPELMALFGVSRNTLREAIQVLIHSGILEARPGDGTYILANDRFAAMLTLRLQQAELAEVLEVRLALEQAGARLAAARRNEQDLTAIESALRLRGETDAAWASRDLAFHQAVMAAAHNPLLLALYGSMAVYIQEALQELALGVEMCIRDRFSITGICNRNN